MDGFMTQPEHINREHWVPTMNLRFVTRTERLPIWRMDMTTEPREYRVLQQRFDNPDGPNSSFDYYEWRDVPLERQP